MSRKPLNTYYYKSEWKIVLLIIAALIGTLSVVYTNYITQKIRTEERNRAKLWAEAIQKQLETNNSEFIIFIGNILQNHTSVPAILVDQNDKIQASNGLDTTRTFDKNQQGKIYDPDYFKEELQSMKAHSIPFEIDLGSGEKNYIYYKDSTLLRELRYFPYVQLTVIVIFLVIAYFAFSRSRRAEQNQVWVGMAKETAHQLGTPISALIAWMDHLREKYRREPIFEEMENDIYRLQMIADRFSKIGSAPVLESQEVVKVIEDYIQYFGARISNKIELSVTGIEVQAQLSVPLFEWVIENLCKNAINAMGSEGKIEIQVQTQKHKVIIDVRDTGKGIPKFKWETIFQPGYTTRKRGWGLGLSLTRRIIENYHSGEIFVKESELGKGTTFRIVLLATALAA